MIIILFFLILFLLVTFTFALNSINEDKFISFSYDDLTNPYQFNRKLNIEKKKWLKQNPNGLLEEDDDTFANSIKRKKNVKNYIFLFIFTLFLIDFPLLLRSLGTTNNFQAKRSNRI